MKVFPSWSEKTKTCEFNLWAPRARDIKLVITEKVKELPMNRGEFGYWKLTSDELKPVDLYKYKIDDGESFPDPASLSQPEGVHGPSQVIDLNEFKWTDQDWKNIPQGKMIQYELHTGTFSEQENFEGIISKLKYFKELGINTIEILPVAQFSGKRNWGYDGVYPFAVHDSYGGPLELMRLVNECHKHGIAVVLDVVYNHLGPEGNYTSQFGHYFSEKYNTPWGKPLNFDGAHSDGVRNFVVQNALMWCRDFHMDGLRLDAVHAIFDFGARHIMQELAENIEDLSKETGRDHYLIAESNLNDVRYINGVNKGGYGLEAQWSDDFHHAVHTLVTGEDKGYYMDYGKSSDLTDAIKKAFVYDGKYSPFRKKTYGNDTQDNPPEQFVIFNQNHDQTGNRKFGERLISLTGFETAKLVAGTMFVSPYIPMLFMGEEYGEENPFLYFVSHLDSYLNELVRKGRSQEFKDFYDDKQEAPDPSSPDTFHRSKLSWKIQENDRKKAMFEYYKNVISLRKEQSVLNHPDKKNLRIMESGKVFTLHRWNDKQELLVFMNYNNEEKSQIVNVDFKRKLNRELDSSSTVYGGPGSLSPESLKTGDELRIAQKAIVIYSN